VRGWAAGERREEGRGGDGDGKGKVRGWAAGERKEEGGGEEGEKWEGEEASRNKMGDQWRKKKTTGITTGS